MAASNGAKRRKEELEKMPSEGLSDHELTTRATIDNTVYRPRPSADPRGLIRGTCSHDRYTYPFPLPHHSLCWRYSQPWSGSVLRNQPSPNLHSMYPLRPQQQPGIQPRTCPTIPRLLQVSRTANTLNGRYHRRDWLRRSSGT